MGREIKRVPVDFAWPIDKTWQGFLMPDSLREITCTACTPAGEKWGDGLTVEARAVANTFYPLEWGNTEKAKALAWHDKIGQAEVDNLLANHRLQTLVPREPTPDNPRSHEWQPLPRTAAEVNAEQRAGGLGGHDAINRMILVEFRCERLGIPYRCASCEGHGTVEKYEGQRADAEAWEATEPPEGEGWQVWETVSEGSPISPIFPDREGIVAWLCSPAYTWGISTPLTREQAERFVDAAWAPSMIASAATGLVPGEQATP